MVEVFPGPHAGRRVQGWRIHPPRRKGHFVFAGGTSSSFEEFASNMPVQEESLQPEGNAEADPSSIGAAKKAFRSAKGPDFVSRLRGFINVMGPNRQGKDDDAYIIRRAKMLRVMLGNAHNAGGLYDSRKTLRIDSGLLRAMLHVREYKHGTRSIQAIIDMSRLAGKKRFDLSALPPSPSSDCTWMRMNHVFDRKGAISYHVFADAGSLEPRGTLH